MMSPVPEEERHKPTHDAGNEIEDAEHPDVVINADSSDSDGEGPGDIGYMGYQALNQDIGGPDSEEEEASDSEEEATSTPAPDPGPDLPANSGHRGLYPDFPNNPSQLPNYMQVPEVPRPDKTEMLWNQPRSSDIRLDTGQADKIKSLMTGIQLPSSNIPDWAKSLSDDQWQSQVVSKLVRQRTSPKLEGTDTNVDKQENRDTGVAKQDTDTTVSKTGSTCDTEADKIS